MNSDGNIDDSLELWRPCAGRPFGDTGRTPSCAQPGSRPHQGSQLRYFGLRCPPSGYSGVEREMASAVKELHSHGVTLTAM